MSCGLGKMIWGIQNSSGRDFLEFDPKTEQLLKIVGGREGQRYWITITRRAVFRFPAWRKIEVFFSF